ncbi:hypothetical protein LJB96_03220 [Methanobrevibacter sp. OttesenSCG-928-K11]|nr:hypothetical protein [Methanobrevibacter sp. OttesenSCG-928-K11]MDL2270776.1 hypothetical protein [Methanobrevibacter sp. OttesenSCG-928-I08]
MNKNLKEELDFTLNILIKSAFYNKTEILEIIEEQFIDEDIDVNDIDIVFKKEDNVNFKKLEEAFKDLSKKGILTIHNCGYDAEEGIADAFELYDHLKCNNLNPIGFCFYSFEDIEEAILEDNLYLTFADFEYNKQKALDIGKIIVNTLNSYDFNIKWLESVDEPIILEQFKWDKSYNNDIYEIEGAYEIFKKFNS